MGLNLRDCGRISRKSIELLKTFQRLESLDLSYCSFKPVKGLKATEKVKSLLNTFMDFN